MGHRTIRFVSTAGLIFVSVLGAGQSSQALPAPGPLRFIDPTPANGSVATSSPILVKLDASCDFDTGTLAVSLNGNAIPAASFLPFSACTGGRITSQTVNAAITLPNGTIGSAPSQLSITNLASPPSGNFTASGNGQQLRWNFDGGSAPQTGSPVNATFRAAGSFTVRLQATSAQGLAASGLASGNLVNASRSFDAGDPTPDSRVVDVGIDADLDFANFESSHVHPLALSEAGDELYAVNTPENRLAIFDVAAGGALTFAGDVPVGFDPVSLAVRPGTSEVWVANHLSDNVSIVDTAAMKVVATLAVGDEPTDIVFASGRAFVALAGNQDKVKVYDASTRAEVATLDIFGDDPRSLATNASGTEVYLVVLESGNKSTALFHELVSDGGGPPAPSPPRAGGIGPAPAVGLIVQFNPATGDWEDETGDDWSNYVDFTIADNDVFVIDADAATPSVVSTVDDVGTILFDVAVKPGSGELWVPNTEARNLVRFEPNLRGHLVETRVSRVNAGSGSVTPVDLNPHINYAVTPGSAGEIADSVAHPGQGVFNAAGNEYYLTAFGSAKVAVLDGSAAVTDLIDVGGGPSGVTLNEDDDRLYVLNRFDNTISVVDTVTKSELSTIGVAGASQFDPSPDVVKVGRKFLYDARITSGHGDTACATCHVFGNFDNIAWDLGDPQGDFVDYDDAPWVTFGPFLGPSEQGFDPMKGPMTTQTLRGLKNLEPFHWRGDRQNFQHFNGAFVGLMGMEGFCEVSMAACESNDDCPGSQKCLGLSPTDMDAYTDFIMTVKFPPNPFRNLNDTVPASILVPDNTAPLGGPVAANPLNGQTAFSGQALDAGVFTCAQCHALPTGTNNNLFNGNAEGESQDFKIPQLRNMYEKAGFDVIRPGLQSGNANNVTATSVFKRGFGFLHDGSLSLTEFLAAGVFTSDEALERDMFAFMLAFPTESKPCVGWSQTVTAANKSNSIVIAVINGLVSRAEAGQCDLIAKGVQGGVAKGYVYDTATDLMLPDSTIESGITANALRMAVVSDDVVTFTGVPPGAGVRLGIDRDRDSFLDRFEKFLGYDPADPHSNPWEAN
jgi:YVTN family beta-propeller protein